MGDDTKHMPCGNEDKFHEVPGCDYDKNCDPAPTGWNDLSYESLKKGKRVPRRWEAHHVLSIAALADSMHDLDPDVAKYVQRCKAETKWCINQKPNMLALPRFGHSVKWYMEGIAKDGAAILKGLPPPL